MQNQYLSYGVDIRCGGELPNGAVLAIRDFSNRHSRKILCRPDSLQKSVDQKGKFFKMSNDKLPQCGPLGNTIVYDNCHRSESFEPIFFL